MVKMRANVIMLSLVIITLCLTAEYYSLYIMYPRNVESFNAFLGVADKYKRLSVIYFVMDDTDDSLLEDLARKFNETLFIKIDTTVVKFLGQVIELDRQPDIMFHKYYNTERPFFCNNQRRLEILIEHRVHLESTDYSAIFEADPEVAANTPKVEGQEYENHMYNVIQRPKDTDTLFDIQQRVDRSEKLCLVYLVKDTYEYDRIFNKLARKYSSTEFIRIDITKIMNEDKDEDGNQFSIETQPEIYFYKSECTTSTFTSTNENVLELKIVDYERMSTSEFCELSKIDDANPDESQPRDIALTQVHYDDDIKRPHDTAELFNLMKKAYQSSKLCLIYIVNNTDKYDSIFNKLAEVFIATIFIKIDTTTLRNTNGYKFSVGTQPKFYFYKFGRTSNSYTSTDIDELSNIITDYEHMNEENFS